MATLNISLPDRLKVYITKQVDRGCYGSDSEYVRELIRKDKSKKDRKLLELKILEGLQGEGRELNSGDWKEIEKKALSRTKKEP